METLAQEFQKQYEKDGSILKGIRCEGGLGIGLIAGGIVFLVAGLPLALLALAAGSRAALAVGAFFAVPALLLILPGIYLKGRKRNKWMDYYLKSTGFSEEEIRRLDEELKSPDILAFGNRRSNTSGRSEGAKGAPMAYFVLTEHYAVMPLVAGQSWIHRIEDIAAAAYSQSIPGINGVRYGLLVLSQRGEETIENSFLVKKSCQEIIQALAEKNPAIITDQTFQYEGKFYDMIENPQAIVALVREHRRAQGME